MFLSACLLKSEIRLPWDPEATSDTVVVRAALSREEQAHPKSSSHLLLFPEALLVLFRKTSNLTF